MEQYYKSQWSQDHILNTHFFKNSRNGIFIDIGANDGICGSNSYFFEKSLNWSGICVEPNPEIFKRLKLVRNCTLVNKGVYDKETKIPFMKCSTDVNALSGILECYDQKHIDRINRETKNTGNDIINIDTIRFDTLLEENKIDIVDYLSIDTEGSEFEIIKSIDFKKSHINIINYEENYPESLKSKELREFLEKNGFKFWKKLGGDNVYLNTLFRWSWCSEICYKSDYMLHGWTFYPRFDVIGYDIKLENKKDISELLKVAEENNCVAFNTLGFLKGGLNKLEKSKYFTENDGIFIKN